MIKKEDFLPNLNETLDPENWEHYQQLGYKMIDDIIDYLKNIEKEKVWQPIPEKTIEVYKTPIPQKGTTPENVYEDAKKLALKHPYGNIHPRFWAWINSPGTIMGVFAETLGATINSNCIYGDHGAIHIESQVLSWIKEMYSLPTSYSGVLVSGGSMANLYGLTVARNSFNESIREKGVEQQLTIYCSTETHNSVDKAIELLGIGRKSLRKIPVKSDFTIDLNILQAQIEMDRNQGFVPFCVVGNAGTVNTGAIDPLNDLADICEKENLWLHLDGVYGLLAHLVETERDKLNGFERADSLAFDLHKWMYVNYSVGCVLFKSKEQHKNAFAIKADYLMDHERGLRVGGGPNQYNDLGVELTRPNRALKVWMSIKEHGIEKYARMLGKDIQLAKYLEKQVNMHLNLELMAPVNLSIVCFRFNPGGLSREELNHINKEILMDLQESGDAVISSTFLNGNYVFRTAITNHRSKMKDIDILVKSILKLSSVYAVLEKI